MEVAATVGTTRMAVATAVGLTSIPPDVSDVAARNELTPAIHPVLTMTQEVFRECSTALRVERDAEIESEEHIVIEVDVTAWSVDDMLSAWNRWSEELCRICPPENSVVFQIRLVKRA
jgi:hypothetical protein